MGNARGNLPEIGQTLDLLPAGQALGLIGVFNDGQIQIKQLAQGENCRLELRRLAIPAPGQSIEQTRAHPGHRHVAENLVQAEFRMAKPNTPATLDIVCVIDSGEQIPQPAEQAGLEPLYLGRSTREYLAGLMMAINLLVEIHDDGVKSPFEPPGDRLDRSRIHFGPAHIPL